MQVTSDAPTWLGMLLGGIFACIFAAATAVLLVNGREVPNNLWFIDFTAGGALFGGAVPFGHLSTLGQHLGQLTATINHALSKVPVKDGVPQPVSSGTPSTSRAGSSTSDAAGGE